VIEKKIDIKELAKRFILHASKLRSARFVCSKRVALEGWFRAEIVPVLEDMGIAFDKITPIFSIDSNRKADLAIQTENGFVAFEFKCFVAGADANKKKTFPQQLDRLERAVETDKIIQGIAFVTFSHYSDRQLESLIQKFFKGGNWETTGPLIVIDSYPLQIYLGSFTKNISLPNFHLRK
jgi:hypothetical protein